MSQSVHTKHRGSPPSHQRSVQHVLALDCMDGCFQSWKPVENADMDNFLGNLGRFSLQRLMIGGRVRDVENFLQNPPGTSNAASCWRPLRCLLPAATTPTAGNAKAARHLGRTVAASELGWAPQMVKRLGVMRMRGISKFTMLLGISIFSFCRLCRWFGYLEGLCFLGDQAPPFTRSSLISLLPGCSSSASKMGSWSLVHSPQKTFQVQLLVLEVHKYLRVKDHKILKGCPYHANLSLLIGCDSCKWYLLPFFAGVPKHVKYVYRSAKYSNFQPALTIID